MPPDDIDSPSGRSFNNEWAGELPKEFNNTEALSQFYQYIFQLWKQKEGPCRGCPNYYKKDQCHPRNGMGNADADIMIIGRVPGAPEEIEKEDSNRKAAIDKINSQPEFREYPLAAFYSRQIEEMQEWQGISTLRNNLIEHNRGLNADLQDIYFTNDKKCHDVAGDDNEAARKNCRQYLAQEIRLVDPTVIVTWGRYAAIGAATYLGYPIDSLSNNTMELPNGDYQPTSEFLGYRDTEPFLITMPHWSGIRGNNPEKIPGYDPSSYEETGKVKMIYYELADLLHHLIQGTDMKR